MYPYPSPNTFAKGISLLKNIKWGNLLDGAGKTLNVINQAIPIVYQVKPLINNAKTIFKIADAINDKNLETKKTEESTPQVNNSPVFYL